MALAKITCLARPVSFASPLDNKMYSSSPSSDAISESILKLTNAERRLVRSPSGLGKLQINIGSDQFQNRIAQKFQPLIVWHGPAAVFI